MAINFDGPTKRINLTSVTTLSVRELWSAWVDWSALADNSKYLPAFTTLGGDDIDLAAGTKVPVYAFLQNGWRVKPQEADHKLSVTDGILLVGGGGDPFVSTAGAYNVLVLYQQPVQAISFATGGGGGATPESIAEAVLAATIEGGLTLQGVQRLLLSVATGKSSQVDLGGGAATVTFRDLGDTKTRVTATMLNSSRTAASLDATD